MTYNNFEENLPESLIAKGKDYFDAGAVVDLIEQEAGHWSATVEGTHLYEVEVVGKRSVKDWCCDCPYDDGPICKHVVAVLYAVKEKKGKKTKSSKRKSHVDEIFEKVEPAELLKFFKKNLHHHKRLKQNLLTEFMDVLSGGGKDKYARLVDTVIKNTAIARGGYYDFKSARQLSNAIDRILEQAIIAVSKKNYIDAFEISSNVIIKIPPLFQYIDDSNGYLQSSCYYSLEVLELLFEAEHIAPALRDRIFYFVLERFENDDSGFDLVEDMLTNLLEREWEHSKLIEIEKVVQRVFDNLEGEYIQYAQERYLKILIHLAERTGNNAKKESLINAHLYFPDIAMLRLEELIQKEDFEKAKQLINDAINIAKEKNHSGTESKWKDQLIRVAQVEQDVTTERQLLVEAFFEEYNAMEYYDMLKKTYSEKDWPQTREQLINEISLPKYNKRNSNKQNLLAQIFTKEKFWDRLLALLQQEDTSIHLVIKFGPYLHKNYPAEILELYKPMMIQSAKHTRGRSHYRQLAHDLRSLLKIKGGREVVKELLAIFRTNYANRPAMMDELEAVL